MYTNVTSAESVAVATPAGSVAALIAMLPAFQAAINAAQVSAL